MDPHKELTASAPRAVGLGEQLHLPQRSEASESGGNEGVVAYWRMIVRHRWTVALIAFLGLVAGVLLTLPQTPVYQAHTSLEVQGLNENFLNLQNLNPTSAPGGY